MFSMGNGAKKVNVESKSLVGSIIYSITTSTNIMQLINLIFMLLGRK